VARERLSRRPAGEGLRSRWARGPSNSRSSLARDFSNETEPAVSDVARELLRLSGEGTVTGREAERLVGWLVMERVRDEDRSGGFTTRPPSTAYRIESVLRKLRLPLVVQW
jgi:hypothetical protein